MAQVWVLAANDIFLTEAPMRCRFQLKDSCASGPLF